MVSDRQSAGTGIPGECMMSAETRARWAKYVGFMAFAGSFGASSLKPVSTSSLSIRTWYVASGLVAGGPVGLPVRRSKQEPCSQHSTVQS